MLVDDDEIVLEVTRERLESAGYEVIVRQSGIGTSAAYLREKPDFLLLDIHMPGLGGEALAKLLNGVPADRRPSIILYSSESRERIAELVRQCGAIGGIQKTSRSETFLAEFEQCAARRRMPATR